MVQRKLIGLFCCCLNLIFSQSKIATPQKQEAGFPFIQNYDPEDYNAHAQNWGVVQDSMGIMYFANGDGVLLYDGVRWEKIALPGRGHAKSIAIDKNNLIYVGASGEFGYLEPNNIGKLKYVSLSSLLEAKDQNFTTVWEIHTTGHGVYFRSNQAIFRWKDGTFKVWHAENSNFRNSFWLRDTLFMNVQGTGLHYLDNDLFNLIPNGNFFSDKRISALLPYEEKELLIGTWDDFYLYENETISPFKTEVDDFLRKNKLYSGIQLNNGNYALATSNGGIAVIDNKGSQTLLLDKEGTLITLSAHAIFQDKSGLLWAALDYGISKIEFPSPFSNYDMLGINNRCFVMARYNDELYAGTTNGLFCLKPDPDGRNSFRLLKGINDRIWDLLVFGDKLLIAWEQGVYQLQNDRIHPIGNWNPSAFYRSSLDPNRVFISLADGIGSIYYKDGKWIDEGNIAGINGSTYTIIEEASGNLWLETSEDWVWRVSFSSRDQAIDLLSPKAEKFGPNEGLPEDTGNIYKINSRIFFASDNTKETFVFDESINKFRLDDILNKEMGIPNNNLYIEHVANNGDLFYYVPDSLQPPKHQLAFKTGLNTFKSQNLREERISERIGETTFVDQNDIIWHGGNMGIIRYDMGLANIIRNTESPINTILHKVIYKGDSLLVAGVYRSSKGVIPFKNNRLRFEYSSTSYVEENANVFQYYLQGFDDAWSTWTNEVKKDYTNIPEGDYIFRVRSKNIYGRLGKEANYAFTILPPWYRTWWAYFLYSALILTLLGFVNVWRSKQLRNKNLALEAAISERTHEVIKKNELLKRQTERLKEMDEIKTRFFANISHEFRTPLTLIKGPIQKLEEENTNTISSMDIKMIGRNTDHLLGLINQLLKLSKMDSGQLQLEVFEGDIFKCIRVVASSFGSHAAQRSMDFQIKVPSRLLWVSFDREKMENIVYNLLSNAFKFTPDKGIILLKVYYADHRLHITISDSGSGIRQNDLSNIFNRFYQVDGSNTREKEGSGIGLALTKELVELMNGEIYVESEFGKGSVFKIVLPMEEIIASRMEDSSNPADTTFADENGGNSDIERQRKNETVLIIEDNPDMRRFIKEQLINEYEVLEATNGKEGLKKATEFIPDLIISDIMMPQMDGISLCKKLKTQLVTSHIPVVMLTAKAGLENKLEGLETGADDYLIKPFDAREVAVRIRNLIHERKRLRELFSDNISIDPKEITVSSLDQSFLESVMQLLEERFSDPEFGASRMQNALFMSKTQLHRKLKALTDYSAGELIRNFRLKRAGQLLLQSGGNVSQVAYDVGFSSLSYFTKRFKELHGISPSEFVKKNNEGL